MPEARRLLDQAGGFAHRGLHGNGVPENSMAAFRAALAANFGIECDVRLSRDGKPMVLHDADLRRMCGSPERIGDLDSRDLADRRLVGGLEPIPPLADLLAIVSKRTPVLVELKFGPGDSVEQLCSAVAADIENAAPDSAAIMSFDPGASAWFANKRPTVPRGLIVDSLPPGTTLAETARACRADFVACSFALLGSAQVAEARETVPIACWTIRTAEQRRQAAVQVDALIWEADGRP